MHPLQNPPEWSHTPARETDQFWPYGRTKGGRPSSTDRITRQRISCRGSKIRIEVAQVPLWTSTGIIQSYREGSLSLTGCTTETHVPRAPVGTGSSDIAAVDCSSLSRNLISSPRRFVPGGQFSQSGLWILRIDNRWQLQLFKSSPRPGQDSSGSLR